MSDDDGMRHDGEFDGEFEGGVEGDDDHGRATEDGAGVPDDEADRADADASGSPGVERAGDGDEHASAGGVDGPEGEGHHDGTAEDAPVRPGAEDDKGDDAPPPARPRRKLPSTHEDPVEAMRAALSKLGPARSSRSHAATGAQEWARPVIDLPPEAAGGAARAPETSGPSQASEASGAPRAQDHSGAGEWANPAVGLPQDPHAQPAAPAAPEVPARPQDRSAAAEWASPIIDLPPDPTPAPVPAGTEADALEDDDEFDEEEDEDFDEDEVFGADGTFAEPAAAHEPEAPRPAVDTPARPHPTSPSAPELRDHLDHLDLPHSSLSATVGTPAPTPPPAHRAESTPEPAPDDALPHVERALAAGGAPARLAAPALVALGPDAPALLQADPWALLLVPGLSPQQADLYASGVLGRGWPADEPRRVRAVVTWLLQRAARDGHTAVQLDTAHSVLTHFGVPDADASLRALVADGGILAFADAEDRPPATSPAVPPPGSPAPPAPPTPPAAPERAAAHTPRVLLTLERYAAAEESVAEGVARLMATVTPSDELAAAASALDGDAAELAHVLRESGIALFLAGAAEDPPGAPLALADAAARAGLRTAVAAPTPDAATRIGAHPLRTLLAAGAPPALDLDLLVVTDAGLLDVETAAAVLEAVPDGARLVLAGDPGGLDSSGPGRVFGDLSDLAAADLVPAVRSTTRAPGLLGALAEGVREGVLPPVDDPERQVVLVQARSGEEAVHRCVQLVADSIPRALGIAADDVLVLAPAHGGTAGTTALNAALKARLNPGPGRYDGFDVGDRVVRTGGRNEPLTEAVVVEPQPGGLLVRPRREDAAPVLVPRSRLGELRHGWAVTVHQAVGVRRPGVVAVLPGEAAGLLNRALVYTAFTRAERHLSIVHAAGESLAWAVGRVPERPRTTRLRQAVREAVGTA